MPFDQVVCVRSVWASGCLRGEVCERDLIDGAVGSKSTKTQPDAFTGPLVSISHRMKAGRRRKGWALVEATRVRGQSQGEEVASGASVGGKSGVRTKLGNCVLLCRRDQARMTGVAVVVVENCWC